MWTQPPTGFFKLTENIFKRIAAAASSKARCRSSRFTETAPEPRVGETAHFWATARTACDPKNNSKNKGSIRIYKGSPGLGL